MDKNNKISDKSQRIITFMGYWWVTFSVIFGIVQLSQWAFGYTIQKWWIGLIFFIVVLILSTGIAYLLLKLFPNILDKIFNKLPESKKYFDISKDEELTALKAIIYSNLSNCENDETLLVPLKMLCGENASNDDLLQSIRVGLINSPLFHRLGKMETRALNGVYTLFALEKTVSRRLIKSRSAKYCYVKNYILINDLGWCLSQLSDDDYNDFQEYLKNVSSLYDFISQNSYFDFSKTQKENAIDNIEKAKKDLEDAGSHEKLVAQAIRHLLNIDSNYYTEENLTKLNKVINRIKNDDDKLEMQGHSFYLRAVHAISYLSLDVSQNQNNENFKSALNYINKAQECYESLSMIDRERLAKCYNVRGKLFLKYSKVVSAKSDYLDKAILEFENGLYESKNLMRYDQTLRNLLSLTEIYGNAKLNCYNHDKSTTYAKEGIRIAETLKNYTYKVKFLSYYRPKHIILIRHGESQKNIDKVVNGEGPLTEFGRRTIDTRAKMIKSYLEKYNYNDITIYGHNKCQVRETIEILKDTLCVPEDNCRFNDELRPTDMGVLKGVKESNEESKAHLLILEQWRNRAISAEELTEALGAEEASSYWQRAERFVSSIVNDECAIVVCTTSIAILLTHYLTSPNYTSDRYVHIDVPLGGIIHFAETIDEGKYEIVNRESLININFVKVE